MIRSIVLFVALLPCSSCTPVAPLPIGPEPAPPDDTVVTRVDAGPDPLPFDAGRLDACARACRHLRAIHCPDGEPTPAGTACETVCRTDRAESAARLTTKYLSCLATIATCAKEASCAR